MTAQFQFGEATIRFTVPEPPPARTTLTHAECPKSKPLVITLRLDRVDGDIAIYRMASAEPV